MSNEARLNSMLQIRIGELSYQSIPASFNADVSKANGPTPGAVTVSVNGADINLSQLTAMGGFCRMMNLDAVNLVMAGIRDTITGVFYPLIDLKPGESYIVRLSHDLKKQEAGTGTFSGATAALHAKAVGAPCVCLFECFDP